MVDILSSLRNMMGMQSTQTKEFKEEAVRNNKNVSSVLKDLSSMFAASRSANARQASSLNNIENITSATSGKVDRTNALLQESISLQNQMLIELRTVSKSISSVMSNSAVNQQAGNGSTGNLLLQTALGVGAIAGAGAMGTAAYNYQQSGLVTPTNFSGSNREAFTKIEEAAAKAGSPDPKMTASIAMLESGWLGSSMTQRANNPFGQTITQSQIGSNGIVDGTVGADGQLHAVYESLDAAVAHHLKRWGDKYTNDPDQTLNNLVSGGYNVVNPQWSGSVKSIYMGSSGENSTGNQERDDSYPGANPVQTASLYSPENAQPQQDVMGNQGGRVFQRQRELAGIRKGDLSPNLVRVLEQAASAAGVDVVVYSGGQPAKGSGQGPRTGSTRHDNGNAADLYLTMGKRILSDTNPQDKSIMARFVSAAVAAGATGVGAGHGYMGPSNIHVGFGNPATWGGADWISAAAGGVYSNPNMASDGGYGGMGGYGGGNEMAGLGSLFSMLGMPGANLFGMISSFFGMPIGSVGGAGEIAMPSGLTDYEGKEEEPEEAGVGPGRSRGPGGPLIGSEDYKGLTESLAKSGTEADDSSPVATKLNAIQQAAIADSIEKTRPVVVNSPIDSQEYAMPVQRTEVPQTFVASDNAYARETRATWAVRAAIRPDDGAGLNLRRQADPFGSRITGFA